MAGANLRLRFRFVSSPAAHHVQATSGDASGNYAANSIDISGPIFVPGFGDTTSNHLDVGGASAPARFYRVRLAP